MNRQECFLLIKQPQSYLDSAWFVPNRLTPYLTIPLRDQPRVLDNKQCDQVV